MITVRLLIPAFVVLGLTAVVPSAGAQDLRLLDARCVDVETRSIVPASLWIDGGVLRARGMPDGNDLPEAAFAARAIDLEGAYVLPGLVDLRVYGDVQRSPGHRDSLGVAAASRLALAAGTVAVLDVFATSDRTGDDGARWLAGAPLLVAPGGSGSDFPSVRTVGGPEQARSVVRRTGTRPVQVILDRSRSQRLSPESVSAILDTAAGSGAPVVVEVGGWGDAELALERGVRWLVRLPDGPMPATLRARVAELGSELVWTPQLTVGLELAALVSTPELRDDPLLARVLPDTMRDDYARVRVPQTRLAEVDARRQQAYETLRALDDSGVRLRAGSGAGAMGTALGFTLVREVEAWIEAGIDPWDALRAVTVDAAAVLGVESGFEPGDAADYVVLPASPIGEATALRRTESVVRAGRIHDPGLLAAGVDHRITEDLPDNPLPGGGRVPLVVIVVAGFAVLLFVRRAIKRAAARALAEDEGPTPD
ncbi:MAG TPA: amidohydrolase family protein [Candidatus Krumholzibacteria bacterium]|nr:amidohydrolase family protein [Candidatus Krumholzibacteria bacterium]